MLQRTIDKTIEISKGWKKAKPRLVVHMGGMSLYKVEPYNMVLEEKIWLRMFQIGKQTGEAK